MERLTLFFHPIDFPCPLLDDGEGGRRNRKRRNHPEYVAVSSNDRSKWTLKARRVAAWLHG